jgi:plastocyanin
MPATYTIIITPRGKFVVIPGRVNVSRGQTISWTAVGTNAHVLIPDPTLFESGVQAINIAAGTTSTPVAVSTSALTKVYPYSVFCDAAGEFAQGNSDPELIVGP